MSYFRAEEVLPQELIETIQQYVQGKAIYIPCVGKQAWGSQTNTKRFLQKRNQQIYLEYREGAAICALAEKYALSEKSIQRIIREGKAARAKDEI